MSCKNCQINSPVQKMCVRCFVEYFEHKLRQETKKVGIERGDSVFLDTQNDRNHHQKIIAFYLQKQFAVKIVRVAAEAQHRITASSLENEAENVLRYFFEREKKIVRNQKVLLTTVTQDDIDRYAELNKIVIEKKQPDSEIIKIIKVVHARSLNITTGLANARQVLKDL